MQLAHHYHINIRKIIISTIDIYSTDIYSYLPYIDFFLVFEISILPIILIFLVLIPPV